MMTIAETIVEYKKLSEDEQQYWRDFYESIRKHDEATALGSARREGRAEERDAIAENMRKNGFTEEQIKLALGDA